MSAKGRSRARKSPEARFLTGHRPCLVRPVTDVEISPGVVPLVRWVESRTDGPFTVAQATAAHPHVTPSALKDFLRLCARAQILRTLWYPPLVAHDQPGAPATRLT